MGCIRKLEEIDTGQKPLALHVTKVQYRCVQTYRNGRKELACVVTIAMEYPFPAHFADRHPRFQNLHPKEREEMFGEEFRGSFGIGVDVLDRISEGFRLETAIGWKPNGEKSPTRVRDGSGVIHTYDDDGNELDTIHFEDGLAYWV